MKFDREKEEGRGEKEGEIILKEGRKERARQKGRLT